MDKVINKYKMYTLFSSFLIFMPVLLNIYLARGISISEVLLIESFYYLTITIFEVPTGYLGDKIGHDNLVKMGLLGTFISYILFSLSYNLTMIIISQILMGIFTTCISGSDTGSLSTYLDNIGVGDNIKVHESIYFISLTSLFMAYLASGIVIKIDPNGNLIFIITGVAYLLAIIFFKLFEVEKNKVIKEVKVIEEKVQSNQKDTEIKNQKNDRNIGLMDILICGIMFGILSATYLISQIFYNNVKIDSSYLGIIYCIGSVFTIIFTKIKGSFKEKTLFLFPILFIIPMFNSKLMVIPFLILLSYLQAKVNPFITNFISYNSKDNKAVNLSISNLINNCINGILMLSISGIIYKFGFVLAMALFALVAIILIAYIYKNNSKSFKHAIKK